MYLAESQVSVSTIARLFDEAGISPFEPDTDSFYVKGDGLIVKISVWPSKKVITYLFISSLSGTNRKNISYKINAMNDAMLFVRFSITENNGDMLLASDYQMSFDGGIIRYHPVMMLKRFESIVSDAINEYILADDSSSSTTGFQF